MDKQFKKIKKETTKLSKKLISFVSSKTFLFLTLSWFLIQGAYIAFSTKYQISPDEHYHFQFIKLYSESGFSPFLTDQSGYYFLGDVTRVPDYLYHYLLSFPFRIMGETFSAQLILIRMINVFISLISAISLYKLLQILKIPKLATNMSVFLFTNTLMLVFLAGSVSYDNLSILLTLIAFNVFVQILQKVTFLRLLLLMSLINTGLLVKHSFGPIAVLLVVTLVALRFSELKALFLNLRTKKRLKIDFRAVLITIFFIMSTILFIERYLGNYIKYSTIDPRCETLHTTSQCEQNGIYNRRIMQSTKNVDPSTLLTPAKFTTNWLDRVRFGTFSVSAHKGFPMLAVTTLSSSLLLVAFAVSIIRKLDYRENKNLVILTLISVTYYIILMYINYSQYRGHGVFGQALQGRYGFPVLGILYGASFYYMFSIIGKRTVILAGISLSIIILFFISSLPTYIYRTNDEWYSNSGRDINMQIDEYIDSL